MLGRWLASGRLHLRGQLLALAECRLARGGPAAAARLLHHLFFDLPRHGVEGQVDVLRRLGASLEEGHAKLACELLALLEADLTAVRHVAFVAYENLANASLRVFFDFIDPCAHVVESLTVGHIVHDDDALGAYAKVRHVCVSMLRIETDSV